MNAAELRALAEEVLVHQCHLDCQSGCQVRYDAAAPLARGYLDAVAKLEEARAEAREQKAKAGGIAEMLGTLAATIDPETTKGRNYVEMALQWDDGILPELPFRRVSACFMRTDGKTPHELRQAAEAERDAALARAEVAERKAADFDVLLAKVRLLEMSMSQDPSVDEATVARDQRYAMAVVVCTANGITTRRAGRKDGE